MSKSENIKKTLKFSIPQDLPNIAKFNEQVDLMSAVQPVKMYFKAEEIADDPEDISSTVVVKDAEYYKAKRKGRRWIYKKKSVLMLEDSGRGNEGKRIKFEGRLEQNPNVTIENAKQEAPPFKYVLMQFTKTQDTINIIPVDSFFSFQKHGMAKDASLEEVQEKIESQLLQQKEKISQYRKIERALINGTARDNTEEEDESAMSSNKAKKNDIFRFLDESTLFEGSKFAKKGRGGGGGSSGSSSSRMRQLDENGNEYDQIAGYNNELGGVHGDYNAAFADDDEELVHAEQANINEQENNYVGIEDRYGDSGASGAGNGEDDGKYDDDEDDDDDEDGSGGGNLEGSGADADNGAGMVNESMEASAKEARKMFAAGGGAANKNNTSNINSNNRNSLGNMSNSNMQVNSSSSGGGNKAGVSFAGPNSATAGSASVGPKKGVITIAGGGALPVKSALKRPRESIANETPATASKIPIVKNEMKQSPGNAMETTSMINSAKKVKTTASGAATTGSNATSVSEITLTAEELASFSESGIKAYIQNRGGKVVTSELTFHFKKLVKAIPEGKDKFLAMLLRATDTIDDALLGKVMIVKK